MDIQFNHEITRGLNIPQYWEASKITKNLYFIFLFQKTLSEHNT